MFIIPSIIRWTHVAEFCEPENILYDIVMMEIHHYTSVQTRRMYNSNNERKVAMDFWWLWCIHVGSSLVKKKKKSAILVNDVDNGGAYACVSAGGYMGNLCILSVLL